MVSGEAIERARLSLEGLEVGDAFDGVERRWLSWRKFTPLNDVVALKRTFLFPARLVLRNARTAILPYTFSPRNDLMGARSRALLAIDAALEFAATRATAHEALAATPEKRGDEDVKTWKERLDGEHAGYRTPAAPEEVLRTRPHRLMLARPPS